MKGFNQCEKGHYFKESLDSCPYCPENSKQNNSSGVSDRTQIAGDSGTGNDKTQIFGETTSNDDNTNKTQIFGGGQPSQGRDLSKTFIAGMHDEDGQKVKGKPRATRKTTGWIISYTIDPMGVDFRIYEGKNRIGKDPALEISIISDNTVSGNHAVILYRSGTWYLEDEMSANGTFINDKELRPRNPVELQDNDLIRVGNTTFKFKTAL